MLTFTTQTLPLSTIDPNLGQIPEVPRNPRTISHEDMVALKHSIESDPDFLTLWKVTVYPLAGRYVALSGNQRLRACQELRVPTLQCDVLDPATPPDVLRKIVIKANRQAGQDDLDLLKVDWDFEELQDMWTFPDLELEHDAQLLQAAENDDTLDELPEVVATRCHTGDIWQLGEHRLMCGDATILGDLSRLMDGQRADLLVTDPPYNVDYQGSTGLTIANDKQGDQQFLDFLTKAFVNIDEQLRPGASFYIWHADSEGFNFRSAAKNAGWQVRQVLVWNKNSFVMGRQDYQWKHEPTLYGWKDGAPHYFVDDRAQATVFEDKALDIHRLKKSEMEALLENLLGDKVSTTVIDEPKPARNAEHPTMKPIRLLARLIRNSSQPGWLVLDSFGGSGSTLIACQQLNRRCAMLELDPHYCDVILTRWERLTGGIATKLEGGDA